MISELPPLYLNGRDTGVPSEAYTGGAVPSNMSNLGGIQTLSNVAVSAGKYGLNKALNAMNVPGSIKAPLKTAMFGGTPREIGETAASSFVSELLDRVTDFTNIPGFGAVGGELVKESFEIDPNYAAATARTGMAVAGSIAGSMIGGPLGLAGMAGATLAGYVADSMLEGGPIGDLFDSRDDETRLDAVEDMFGSQGFGSMESTSMAENLAGWDNELEKAGITDKLGTGLDSAYHQTPTGRISEMLGDTPFGATKTTSLADYFESSGGFGDGGHDNDPSGSGDFGDRESSPGGMGGV